MKQEIAGIQHIDDQEIKLLHDTIHHLGQNMLAEQQKAEEQATFLNQQVHEANRKLEEIQGQLDLVIFERDHARKQLMIAQEECRTHEERVANLRQDIQQTLGEFAGSLRPGMPQAHQAGAMALRATDGLDLQQVEHAEMQLRADIQKQHVEDVLAERLDNERQGSRSKQHQQMIVAQSVPLPVPSAQLQDVVKDAVRSMLPGMLMAMVKDAVPPTESGRYSQIPWNCPGFTRDLEQMTRNLLSHKFVPTRPPQLFCQQLRHVLYHCQPTCKQPKRWMALRSLSRHQHA